VRLTCWKKRWNENIAAHERLMGIDIAMIRSYISSSRIKHQMSLPCILPYTLMANSRRPSLIAGSAQQCSHPQEENSRMRRSIQSSCLVQLQSQGQHYRSLEEVVCYWLLCRHASRVLGSGFEHPVSPSWTVPILLISVVEHRAQSPLAVRSSVRA
jgi:hypothetical protein